MKVKFDHLYSDVSTKVKSVRIQCDGFEEYQEVKKFLSFKEKTRKYNFRTRQQEWETVSVVSCVAYSDSKYQFVLKYGMWKILKAYLDNENLPYDLDGVENQDRISIIPKWIERFKNHPKGKEYADNQLETASRISDNDIGIVSLGVGAGKTEILLSVAESYLEQYQGNVIIITYSKKVLDEIKLRAEKYDVSSDRIMFMQPTGFMRSGKSKTIEFQKFALDTDLIIADEAHHFTANLWQKLLTISCPRFVFGFTGSADIESGNQLTYESFIEGKVDSKSCQLMDYCGEMIVHKELTVPIKVVRVYSGLTNRQEYDQYKQENPTKLTKLIQFTLKNEKLPKLLFESISKYIPEDSIVFIPELTEIETGTFLAKELNKLGMDTVYYSAKHVESPVGKIDITLEELKQMARDKMFKVLISNVVGIEGLDLANLSSIVPLTGKSFKNTIQPIGRSARSNLVHCVFIYDTNNPQHVRHTKAKYDIVKNRLNCISDFVGNVEV